MLKEEEKMKQYDLKNVNSYILGSEYNYYLGNRQ